MADVNQGDQQDEDLVLRVPLFQPSLSVNEYNNCVINCKTQFPNNQEALLKCIEGCRFLKGRDA